MPPPSLVGSDAARLPPPSALVSAHSDVVSGKFVRLYERLSPLEEEGTRRG